jgi:hypothetical protein
MLVRAPPPHQRVYRLKCFGLGHSAGDVRVEVRGKLPVDCLWEKTTETYAQNST